MRLGLALGKTRSEIRALPAPEYHDWELFYALEPWGWANTEFQVAEIMALILRGQVSKKKDIKKPQELMRDPVKEIMKQTQQIDLRKKLENMTPEERRDYWLPIVKHDMGVK
jgi:hypothetical protein